ncbi:UNVERIFIED_CONTAM: hypothetical protein FKN15_037350 [Acipenser sinensis]
MGSGVHGVHGEPAAEPVAPGSVSVNASVIIPEKPCTLFCSTLGKDQPILLADKVLDGTLCGPQDSDICANGTCQKISCDGILGSSAKEDNCGLCNGNGKSCKVIKGDFNHTRGAGERKTKVTCTKIVNKTTSVVDNKKCRYLTKPEPQVRKCNDQPCQTRWMMTEWTPCSRTCGKGSQARQVSCTQQLRNGTLIRAKERDCVGHKPAAAQRCEGQDCMTVWEAGVWSECSVKCGKGARHRTVKCTNPRKKCDLSTRPREVEDCEDYSKCYVWRTGDWSKVCSVTCGKGMQSRVIQCMHKITGRHGNECFSSEKPAAFRPCHLQPCNEKNNVNTITSPRLAALTFKCLRDQWPVYCKVIREQNLCQDMRWYQRCCETCRDFYAQKMQQRS